MKAIHKHKTPTGNHPGSVRCAWKQWIPFFQVASHAQISVLELLINLSNLSSVANITIIVYLGIRVKHWQFVAVRTQTQGVRSFRTYHRQVNVRCKLSPQFCWVFYYKTGSWPNFWVRTFSYVSQYLLQILWRKTSQHITDITQKHLFQILTDWVRASWNIRGMSLTK